MREKAYFDCDGLVVHGYADRIEGRRITEAEANEMSARKPKPRREIISRAEEFGPEIVALIGDLAEKHDRQMASLKAEIDAQKAIMADLLKVPSPNG